MRYLLWFVLPFSCAVFLGALLPLWWLSFVLAGAAAVLFLILLICCRQKTLPRLIAAGIFLGLLYFGAYTAVVAQPQWELGDRETAFTATVVSYPTETNYGIALLVHMDSGAAQGYRVRVYLEDYYSYLKPGDQLTGTVSLSAQTTQDAEYSSYPSRGIFLTGSASLISAVSVASIPLRYLPAFLVHMRKESADAILEGDCAALLKGLLTGDKTDLSDAVTSNFRRSGLMHILAVSGLHVGFLVGVAYLLPGRRRPRNLLKLPLLVCFALATGGQPSVWRAVVMSALFLLAPLFNRESDAPTSLAFALLLLLVQNPYSVLSVSLQLSFAALAGLLLFQPRLYQWMLRPATDWGRAKIGRLCLAVWRFIAAGISVSCAALVFTLPLSAYYFQMISLVSPLSGLLCISVASVVFALGFFACILYWVAPTMAFALAVPLQWGLQWLLFVTGALGQWCYSALRLDNLYFRGWFVVLLVLIGSVVLFRRLRRCALLPTGGAVALLLLALALRSGSVTDTALSVTALDVGQGSSTVFVSDGVFVAVDCGGDDAGNVLADYLQGAGCSELSLLVLTHMDSDHINGVEQLIYRIQVDAIALSAQDEEDESLQYICSLGAENDISILYVDETVSVGFGEATITIFSPVDEGENSGCISALCSWAEHYVLVTGDLPVEQEQLLLEREDLPQLDVLIVGHHGSAGSTGAVLLAKLRPEIAIISVGATNSYGHPAQDTLTRLTQYRCRIYRTDEDGSVTIRLDTED